MTDAIKDFTVGLYHSTPIKIFECVGAGRGTKETHGSFPIDRCESLREGKTHRHGDPIEDSSNKLSKLHSELESIEEVLENELMALYPDFKDQDWI